MLSDIVYTLRSAIPTLDLPMSDVPHNIQSRRKNNTWSLLAQATCDKETSKDNMPDAYKVEL